MGGRMVGVEVEERSKGHVMKDVVRSFLFEAVGIEDLKAGNDTISFWFQKDHFDIYVDGEDQLDCSCTISSMRQ